MLFGGAKVQSMYVNIQGPFLWSESWGFFDRACRCAVASAACSSKRARLRRITRPAERGGQLKKGVVDFPIDSMVVWVCAQNPMLPNLGAPVHWKVL